MATQSEQGFFFGFLGRSTVAGDRVELRFYDFRFATEPDVQPVFAVLFEKPEFAEEEVGQLLDCEVEVSVFDDRAELVEIYGSRDIVLRATSVLASRVAYDTEDYVKRVRELDTAYQRENQALVDARKRNLEGQNLAIELLRRAEIKSAASEEQRVRQAAAIAALTRLLHHLRGET